MGLSQVNYLVVHVVSPMRRRSRFRTAINRTAGEDSGTAKETIIYYTASVVRCSYICRQLEVSMRPMGSAGKLNRYETVI